LETIKDDALTLREGNVAYKKETGCMEPFSRFPVI
jgi:hypothetical protein